MPDETIPEADYAGVEILRERGPYFPEYFYDDDAGNIFNIALNYECISLLLAEGNTGTDSYIFNLDIAAVDYGNPTMPLISDNPPVQSVRVVEPRFRDILTKRV